MFVEDLFIANGPPPLRMDNFVNFPLNESI
jgi:hypothetical protein